MPCWHACAPCCLSQFVLFEQFYENMPGSPERGGKLVSSSGSSTPPRGPGARASLGHGLQTLHIIGSRAAAVTGVDPGAPDLWVSACRRGRACVQGRPCLETWCHAAAGCLRTSRGTPNSAKVLLCCCAPADPQLPAAANSLPAALGAAAHNAYRQQRWRQQHEPRRQLGLQHTDVTWWGACCGLDPSGRARLPNSWLPNPEG